MSNEYIKNLMKLNRGKKLHKNTKPKLESIATIQVAKRGSESFKEFLSVFKTENTFYLKLHNKGEQLTLEGSFLIKLEDANIISKVIEDYYGTPPCNLNPYTWLVCGCHYKGLDLIGQGYLDF